MSENLYSSAIIRKCSVNGIDIRNSVLKLHVGTTIFTPYVIAVISILDGATIQDAVYQPGAKVNIVYSAGASSTIREYNMVTLGLGAGVKNPNPRSGRTEIVAVTESYFNMEQEYTGFHQNIQASEVMKKIHAEIDPAHPNLNILASKGVIGSREAYHLRSLKLGRAANMTRDRLTDSVYNSSAFVYYADQNMQYHCLPLEKLFKEASGPTFTRKIGLTMFDQDQLAYNIISLRKGENRSGFGGDYANRYYSAINQRGGKPATGFDWASMTYTPPSSEISDPTAREVSGKTNWAGNVSKKATTVNHRFNYDFNQKTSEDFEGDVANKNMMVGLLMQGSMTINVPLEGGFSCLVGKGCELKIPTESGEGDARMSPVGGKHLILAQGEYVMKGLQGMQGIASMTTSSGGTQGDVYS